jgi:hypothetical protein
MATPAQIYRLSRRVGEFAFRRKTEPVPRCPTVIVQLGETEEAAWERHYLAHPEDRDADRAIVIRVVDHVTATKA